ncbi:adenylate/guanylate cyclase domain-containing protein [Spongiactinospora gelatinilytica]|uniref:Adenylate/guanylate cyclase domain-containing protein n=1 Tax=Spongiactinospora gelatinilytica TaxID=2666298 RepID=A0A2W2HM89_9ACTN|nr:AAA family ATPase [Spongiactinospora gelatinilytica]PZG47077.1 adenylate/guanylate cyclase domain-containing protein [Spongiactinospora gelatinilytica]
MKAGDRRPTRRNVAVLFIDIVGSTELAERLDPELLLHILERYYDACRTEIFQRGGVVEKYIGDAIMAVFGVPVSLEDDALRAVLAADRAMAAVHRLSAELAPTHEVSLDAHCGVAFGQVMVVESPGADVRVIGDTVNTAARLQSAAGDGEILLGDDVARLVRRHAVLDEIPPLSLKGKREPVRAWRLVSVDPERGEPEADTIPLIGRAAELRRLTELHQQVVAERRCGMATLLGVPGIGKSRLVREFLHNLPGEARVLTGRCPAYGVGATYRPIAEMLEPLDLDEVVGPDCAGTLRGLTTGIAEIAQAVRTLFEVLAEHRPLVVVLDDLQWAEPTLLDLIEDCAAWLRDVPVLLICVTRPELYESRPAWGGGTPRAISLEVGPLGPPDTARLVAELCAARADVLAHDEDDVHRRVTAGCDGNPLFAELMLETAAEGDAALPPTIQALLGARLDRLDRPEREVLERAATVGQSFTADQVGALLEAGFPATAGPLRRLQRERLIRRGPLTGCYEFTQTLTRETVYALTSKDLRAGWHRRLADLLRESPFPGDVSHHLLTACRFTREVRPGDPLLPELTDRAAASLIADGGKALHRKDLPAAIALLERGREMLPPGRDEHRSLAVRISDAHLARGANAQAAAALDRAAELLPGDPRNELTCAIQREILALRAAGRAPLLEPLRARLAGADADTLSWCRFHLLEALVHTENGRFGTAEQALRYGLALARAMGDRYEEDRLLGGLCELVQWSPTPVDEGLALCADLLARFAGDRTLLVPVLLARARLLALSGDLEPAHRALDTAGRYADELHLRLSAIAITQVRGLVESLGGGHERARELFVRAGAALRAAGHGPPAATLAVYAARESLRLGEVRRAEAELGAGAAGQSQLRGELTAQAVRARIASLDGDHGRALAAAARLDGLLAATDDPCLHGETLFEIAQIHRAAGRDPAAAAGRALDAYLSKGAGLLVRRVREWASDAGCPRME